MQLIPLKLDMHGCATETEMNNNVISTLSRGYTPINDYLCPEFGGKGRFKGTLSICGAGPSLRDTYLEIEGAILACNSAIGYLLGKGIVPTFGMIWDASPLCEKFAVPHPDITYLLGARCHPDVFKRLHGCKVIAWHAGGDHNIFEFIQQNQIKEPLVNGGSAAVTRGLYLGYALGFRNFHLFGADSSYQENETHVNGSLVPEKDITVHVGNHEGHPSFRTTPEMCAQVEEFKVIYPHFLALGCNITAHGSGMLPYVYHTMKHSYVPYGGHHVATTCV